MRLADWLDSSGTRIADLAREAGISRDAIYCYLRGTRLPGLAVAAAIVQATDGQVQYEDLLIEEEK